LFTQKTADERLPSLEFRRVLFRSLLNVAAGLLTPSAGSTTIFGAPLAGRNAQAGYLFQADALFPWKTALGNVAIGLEVAGIAPRSEERRVGTELRAGRVTGAVASG